LICKKSLKINKEKELAQATYSPFDKHAERAKLTLIVNGVYLDFS